jgi:hypothetical protein
MTEKTAPSRRAAAKQPIPDWITCNGCDHRWTGLNACHRTFTGIRAFDIHRTGGHCNDPAALIDRNGAPRLIPITRRHWTGWGRTNPHDQRTPSNDNAVIHNQTQPKKGHP